MNLDIANYDENSSKGYMLEVDLKYPENIQDMPNDYLLAPENITL